MSDAPADKMEIAKAWAGRVGREIAAGAAALGGAIERLAGFTGLGARRWRQGRAALAAQQELGRALQAAGVGDAELLGQLRTVDERIRSVEAAKGSAKPLKTERAGLHIRLAEPVLGGAAPAAVAAEHQRAMTAREALAATEAGYSAARGGLLPASGRDRLRLAVAAGCTAVLLAGTAWAVGAAAGGDDDTKGVPGDQVAEPSPEAPDTGFVPESPEYAQPAPVFNPVSDSPQTCFACNGTGQQDCTLCFGRGTHSCWQCNGTGRSQPGNVFCSQCNGTGQQKCYSCNYGKVTCTQCGGDGQL